MQEAPPRREPRPALHPGRPPRVAAVPGWAVQDVVVVGSGPNGLAAAVVLARAGLGVTVLEAQDTVGGGARTLDLGLAPGVVHDICSAVHPMAIASPFFAEFDLAARGVELSQPEVAYAQPLDGGRAGLAWRDLDRTVEGLGRDGAAWRSLVGRLAERQDGVGGFAMGDLRSLPPDVVAATRFGLRTLEQGTRAWGVRFRDDVAPALLTGVAMHSISPMPTPASPGRRCCSPPWRTAPAGRSPSAAARRSSRRCSRTCAPTAAPSRPAAGSGRRGPAAGPRAPVRHHAAHAACEVLGDRVPRAAPGRCAGSGTGTRPRRSTSCCPARCRGPSPRWACRARSTWAARAGRWRRRSGRSPRTPRRAAHVLASDPTVADPGREVAGLRPFWTYAHVPSGSDRDVTEDVVAQVERFAPGFRDVVVASRCIPASRMAEHDENYVGGDIAAGAVDLRQVFGRPTFSWNPYRHRGRPGRTCARRRRRPVRGCTGSAGGWPRAPALREVFGVRRAPSLAPAS